MLLAANMLDYRASDGPMIVILTVLFTAVVILGLACAIAALRDGAR